MPENNCSQKVCVDKKSVWPFETLKLAEKVQKGISDSDELKYYLCVKCRHC